MNHYKNDPYPLKVKFSCNCAKCNIPLPRGTNAYYWPSNRKVYCLTCGDADYRAFLASAADEEWYQNQYPKY